MRRCLPSMGVLLIAISFMPAVAGASDMTVGWINKCDLSHRAEDDPIVYPGQPGASHLHDFYGNTSTDASSTYTSLLGKNTTCEFKRDTAAYWFPTVYFNGDPRRPYSVKFYYRSIIDPPSDVQPFPKGLRMVWGDAGATGPQELNKVWWQCDHEEHTATPHDCNRGEHVVYHVKFPECWDGVHLDSVDHRSHMSESVDRSGGLDTCPRSHPVALPRLIARLEFDFRQGSRVTLSSGFPYTLHGDFINSWHQRRLVRLVDRCINGAKDCGVLGQA